MVDTIAHRIGDLRLRLPSLNDPYDGINDATFCGMSCPQQVASLDIPEEFEYLSDLYIGNYLRSHTGPWGEDCACLQTLLLWEYVINSYVSRLDNQCMDSCKYSTGCQIACRGCECQFDCSLDILISIPVGTWRSAQSLCSNDRRFLLCT